MVLEAVLIRDHGGAAGCPVRLPSRLTQLCPHTGENERWSFPLIRTPIPPHPPPMPSSHPDHLPNSPPPNTSPEGTNIHAKQVHTPSPGGVHAGRSEVREKEQGWGPSSLSLHRPAFSPWMDGASPHCPPNPDSAPEPPVIPPPQPQPSLAPHRVLRTRQGAVLPAPHHPRPLLAPPRGSLLSHTPHAAPHGDSGTGPRLSTIWGRGPCPGCALQGSLRWAQSHTEGAPPWPTCDTLDANRKGGDPGHCTPEAGPPTCPLTTWRCPIGASPPTAQVMWDGRAPPRGAPHPPGRPASTQLSPTDPA